MMASFMAAFDGEIDKSNASLTLCASEELKPSMDEILSSEDRKPSVDEVRRIFDRKKIPKLADETDQKAVNPSLIINACGHTCFVTEGNTSALLLTHVQKALQDKLDMQTTLFEIYDRTGVLLRSDQDLRDAVQAGRTPLHGTCDSRFASEIEWMCGKIGALKCEMDGQQQEFKVEAAHLRHELSMSVESARKELLSQTESAKEASAPDLDSQRQGFRSEMDHLREELTKLVASAKKELHSEVESARKATTADLLSHKEEFKTEIELLRQELTLSMESAKKELHSNAEFTRKTIATDLQSLETKCFAQMVQPSHTNAELAAKDQLIQLQDDLQNVSTLLKDDVEAVSQRVSEMAASVQQSLTGYTMCLSQHTEMLQNFTNLTSQCNVFHARLQNVEQGVHNAFLEQLKQDAELIPESIRENDDSPSISFQAQPVQVWPGRMPAVSRQNSDDSRQEALYAISRTPEKIVSQRETRLASPPRTDPCASFASTPPRGIRSQSLSIPPEDAFPRRMAARSWSPRPDRMDARLPLTIIECPARVSSNSYSPTARTASPGDTMQSLELEFDSSRSSSPEREEGTYINSARSSLHSSPSQAEVIRMEDAHSQSGDVAPEDTHTPPTKSSYSSMVLVSASASPSSEDAASCSMPAQSPRFPLNLTSRAPCDGSGPINPRPSICTNRPRITLQNSISDAISSISCSQAESSSIDSSLVANAWDAKPWKSNGIALESSVTSAQQMRLESAKPEAPVVTPRGVRARINAAFRSQSPDPPPVVSPSSNQSVVQTGKIRTQRMLGFNK